MINSYWIRWSSEHKKETSRKLCSIRMKASITRLRRTTHDSRLEALGVKGSYSRKATCLDNAYIEPFFSHLKTEKLTLNCVIQKRRFDKRWKIAFTITTTDALCQTQTTRTD
ncbi:hypothetical protein [Paenibacillus taichungensis]|uniref:hypothetical protein n=1 Tax=Paenibacillus taichungensis TaxID=484184 RepID=UPI0011B52E93|nr:hypothetical protein [Paenibacillus taichungensis]